MPRSYSAFGAEGVGNFAPMADQRTNHPRPVLSTVAYRTTPTVDLLGITRITGGSGRGAPRLPGAIFGL